MKNTQFAPIVIFAYKRPEKLEKLIESLISNEEFQESKIIFFVDKYKDEADKEKNLEVLGIINKYSSKYNFEIFKNTQNLGLRENIIQGINKSLNEHRKCIFLEDDLVVGKHFLSFMNKSLELYETEKKVKHISGYNYPNFFGTNNSSYFTNYMSCWGWATWLDRWEENLNFSDNNISNLVINERRKFNIYGFDKDYESQLIRNENKEIETWAIYWFQHIFLSKGLCLNPKKTLVQNTGDDNQGVHKTNNKIYNSPINNKLISKFPNKISFNNLSKIQTILFYITKKIKKKLKLY